MFRSLRRFFLLTFLLSAFFPLTLFEAPPAHADDDGEILPRYLSVDLQLPGRKMATQHTAIVRDYSDANIPSDVWVPAELLTQMKAPIALSEKKDAFSLTVKHPGDALGVKALKRLAPQALELSFAARSEDNRQHFNLSQIEHITGVAYELPKVSASGNRKLTVGLLPFMAYQEKKHYAPDKLPELKRPINLLWDHVIKESPDLSAEAALPTVTVLSPTWFALTDDVGGMSNKANVSYVRAAHGKPYRVWALVSNSFNKARTSKFLADGKAQNLFIARLLAYAAIYGFDGINIDFEGVDNADASRLTAFVQKLTTEAKTMGLTVSIDILKPSKWSTCYERKKLAAIVDYVAVMTYDEHWRTAPKAGSTASLPWVRTGVADALADIPAGKLLLGIPFYTREWEETTAKNGKVSVKSKALGMASVDIRLQETSSDKRWHQTAEQHYFEYVSDDKTYKVWMEDEKSLALRLDLVHKHQLAGAAFWRKGFETAGMWPHIEKAMKKGK